MNIMTLLLIEGGAGTAGPSPAPPVVEALEPPGWRVSCTPTNGGWARDEHPAFGRELISEGHAYRLLSRIQAELVARPHTSATTGT